MHRDVSVVCVALRCVQQVAQVVHRGEREGVAGGQGDPAAAQRLSVQREGLVEVGLAHGRGLVQPLVVQRGGKVVHHAQCVDVGVP